MNILARILLAAAITNAPVVAWSAPACAVQRQVVRKQIVTQQPIVVQQYGQQVYTAPLYPQNQVYLNQIAPHQYYGVGLEVQLDAIAEKISKKIEAQLQAKLKMGQQGPAVHPGAAIMAAKCANCHREGSKPVADKGAPVLFDASQKWLGTRDQAIAAISLVKRGAMPPEPAKELEDDEFIAIKSYLDRISSRKDESE